MIAIEGAALFAAGIFLGILGALAILYEMQVERIAAFQNALADLERAVRRASGAEPRV